MGTSDPLIQVRAVTEVDGHLVDAFARLLPQLSAAAAPLGRSELAAIVEAAGTTVLVASIQGREWEVVGTLTLVQFLVPTGPRAWIEDVVVESAVRGSGVGAELVGAAVELARSSGARSVELTSRPARESANRLYRRLGFQRRETNVYRLDLA